MMADLDIFSFVIFLVINFLLKKNLVYLIFETEKPR